MEFVLIEGLMEDLHVRVQEAVEDGVDVFVGGGANAEIITRENPLVKINLTLMDYIDAILKAKQFGKKIGIVSYKSTSKFELGRLQHLLGVEIQFLSFQDPEELEEIINKSEVEVVIGASLSNEIAVRLGIPGILIYPGEEAIINAIKEAKSLAIALKKEREKSKIFQAILDFTPSGIIALDENGVVITFNPSAESICGIDAKKAMGAHIKDILPEYEFEESLESKRPLLGEIKRVKNNEVVINRVPIENNDQIIGTVATIQKVLEIQKAEYNIRLQYVQKGFTAKTDFLDLIGKSKIFRKELQKAKNYARTNSNILIYGETGVGKELFAQSIHNYSLKQSGPFVAVNCAALPESLLESELFGYDEGAFTGGRKGGKAGLFELAHGGTIFLDEIGEISFPLQSRLLRVLQEKEVFRIGGDRVIPIDVRIVSATNKNLEEKIPNEFREDLFYRLNVLQLNIPPLRQRDNDVVDLFYHFLRKHVQVQRYLPEIDSDSLNVLLFYSWPGNIRELENVIERISINLISDYDFKKETFHSLLVQAIGEQRIFNDILKKHGFPAGEKVKNAEISKDLVHRLCEIFPGQKNNIAKMLGVSRTTLWRILEKD
ncbi:MAG: sigma 54-interacting transcriptional regulator [Peptococcaceae bacterium]